MTITPASKVSLSIRDWAAILSTLIGGAVIGAVYVERRVSSIESDNERQNMVMVELASSSERNYAEMKRTVQDLAAVVVELRVVTTQLKTILDERKPQK